MQEAESLKEKIDNLGYTKFKVFFHQDDERKGWCLS